MDQELKIKVTTDGGITINELEKRIKELRAEFKASAIGSTEFDIAAKELKKTLEQKSKATGAAATENAKLMQSYFKLGEKLRRNTNPAFISLNQIVQDAPFGIRGMGNNIQFLTQQFTQLRASGMSTSEILKGMMQNLLSPMGALMFAVSAGTTALTIVMDKLGATSKDTSEKLGELVDQYKELHRLRFDVGKESEEQRRQYLRERVRLFQFAYDEAKNPTPYQKTTQRFVQGEGMVSFTETITPQKATAEQLLDIEKQLNQAMKEQKDFEKEITGEKEKQSKEAMRQFEALLKLRVAQRDFESKTFVTANGTRAYDYNKSKPFDVNQPLTGVNVPKVEDGESFAFKHFKDESEKNLRNMMSVYNSVFFDPIRSSFSAIASGSQSMADAFVKAIKQMITKLLELAAASAILSALGLGDFGTNFKLLSGLSNMSQSVSVDNGSIASGATTQAMSNSMSMGKTASNISVNVMGKISGRDILVVNSREQAFQNAVKI